VCAARDKEQEEVCAARDKEMDLIVLSGREESIWCQDMGALLSVPKSGGPLTKSDPAGEVHKRPKCTFAQA
jgi:hypothetical protein